MIIKFEKYFVLFLMLGTIFSLIVLLGTIFSLIVLLGTIFSLIVNVLGTFCGFILLSDFKNKNVVLK
jgi:hypothetical protein